MPYRHHMILETKRINFLTSFQTEIERIKMRCQKTPTGLRERDGASKRVTGADEDCKLTGVIWQSDQPGTRIQSGKQSLALDREAQPEHCNAVWDAGSGAGIQQITGAEIRSNSSRETGLTSFTFLARPSPGLAPLDHPLLPLYRQALVFAGA
jgi:hypothetical protein